MVENYIQEAHLQKKWKKMEMPPQKKRQNF